jgi:serine/threonine protein kinase
MSSLLLSEISFAIMKHQGDLKELIKGPNFNPIWFEKQKNNRNKAKSFTGNFAVTYHFQSKGHAGKTQDYGIRMWHSNITKDDYERYRKLNNELVKLNKSSPSYIRFAPMELLEPPENGFLVKGKRFPCLKMEWQEAKNLDDFIATLMEDRSLTHTQRSSFLREIKQKIIEVGTHLHNSRSSHGDLSSGNLMVSQKPDTSITIHVVDFDSFYSQTLSHLSASSIGHQDWQHPRYISGELDLFGLPADYCPLLCLIITLEGLATNELLYDQFSSRFPDGGGIIIRRKDLKDPEKSQVFQAMIDSNNSILTTHIDDLVTFLKCTNTSKVQRPKSLETQASKVARPTINPIISQKTSSPSLPKSTKKPYQIKIESEKDLQEALDSGVTQMTIIKAMTNRSFTKKFTNKVLLKMFERVVEHFGGVENCERELGTRYVWAMRTAGESDKAYRIGQNLFDADPGDPNLGFLLFSRLRNKKKWKELLKATSLTLDLTPTNVNVNIFHSLALLNTSNEGVKEAFGESRIRTNDDLRILCEIIHHCSTKQYSDEGLCKEVFTILMETGKDGHLNLRKKDKILSKAIVEYLSSSTQFKEESIFDSILRVEPIMMLKCKDMTFTSGDNLQSLLEKLDSIITKGNHLGPEGISKVCEIFSLLALWGTGDPNTKIVDKIQLIVSRCNFVSEDNFSIGLTFDTKPSPDYMMLYTNSGWVWSKNRTPCEISFGNIWE